MSRYDMTGTLPWWKYIWKGHIVNWFWRDRLQRRITRNKAYGELKMSYLQRFAEYAKGIKAEHLDDSESISQNDKAFTLWFQGKENAPDIVKKCLQSLKERFDDRLLILEEKDLKDYITLPDYIMEKWKEEKITPAGFSDIVRIELLYQYGGYWFDATDFMIGDIPEEISKSSFFMYVSSDVFFPHMFVQTCFIRGKRRDPLMGMWRNLVHEYWKREDRACEYFLVHMLLKLLVRENETAKSLFEKMPKRVMDPTHLLWYKYGNIPYDPTLHEEICAESFFQKCSYRPQKNGIKEIIPGSMVDLVINGKTE